MSGIALGKDRVRLGLQVMVIHIKDIRYRKVLAANEIMNAV